LDHALKVVTNNQLHDLAHFYNCNQHLKEIPPIR